MNSNVNSFWLGQDLSTAEHLEAELGVLTHQLDGEGVVVLTP